MNPKNVFTYLFLLYKIGMTFYVYNSILFYVKYIIYYFKVRVDTMSTKPYIGVCTRIVIYSVLAHLVIAGVGFISFMCKLIDETHADNCSLLGMLMAQNIFVLFLEILIVVAIMSVIVYANKKLRKISSEHTADIDNLKKQFQRELEEKNELIRNLTSLYEKNIKSSSQKSEFFYNMSHELKTPLSVILGAIQLISQKYPLDGNDRRKSTRHLITIKQNCYRLLRLINNILDISRIDSGYIKTNMVNCNIVYLVEDITSSVIPYVEQKGLTLEFDTLEEEIITAVDVDKIERIILNLLSNAVKFTNPGGKITVKVAKKFNKVIIKVKDTGIGIPKNMQAAIFERYRQVKNGLTAEIEGSGIGLSIVKSFVALHNGVIKVRSKENKGSEFIISLPIQLCEENQWHDPNGQNSQSRIIEAINIEFSDIYSMTP